MTDKHLQIYILINLWTALLNFEVVRRGTAPLTTFGDRLYSTTNASDASVESDGVSSDRMSRHVLDVCLKIIHLSVFLDVLTTAGGSSGFAASWYPSEWDCLTSGSLTDIARNRG